MGTKQFDSSLHGPIRLRSKMLGLMGDLYTRRGDFEAALVVSLEKLYFCEALEDWKGIASSYLSLGHTYRLLNHFGRASDNYRKALAVSRRHGLREKTGESLSNIATVYYLQKEMDKALEFFMASLSELRKEGGSPLLGRTLMHIGNIHRKGEESKKAERFYNEAVKVLKTVGDEYNLGMTLANRALLSFAEDDEAEGRTYLREAFERLSFAGAFSEIQLFKATLETVYGIDS